MSGPVTALLRFRVAFALAGLLAAGAATLLLEVGGAWGFLALVALLAALFLVLGVALVLR